MESISAFTYRSQKSDITEIVTDINVMSYYAEILSPKAKTYRAVWDTGASTSCISSKVYKDLHLVSSGNKYVSGIGSKDTIKCPMFYAKLLLPNKMLIEDIQLAGIEENRMSDDVIIGMDILSRGDFILTHLKKNAVMSFRIPSQMEIDFEQDESTY